MFNLSDMLILDMLRNGVVHLIMEGRKDGEMRNMHSSKQTGLIIDIQLFGIRDMNELRVFHKAMSKKSTNS